MNLTNHKSKAVFSIHGWETTVVNTKNTVFDPQFVESADAKPADTKG